MSIQPNFTFLDASRAFIAPAVKVLSIRGGKWDRENESAAFNPVTKTTHIGTHTFRASIYMCSVHGPFSGHSGFYNQHLKPWIPKFHEARTRQAGRAATLPMQWSSDLATDAIDEMFLHLNPHAMVRVETVCTLVGVGSPFNVSGEPELRWAISASAPMKRKGVPVTFIHKVCTVTVEAAHEWGLNRLGEYYFSFFGPDYLLEEW